MRQNVASSGVAITFTKTAANIAAQNLAAWIETNRGSLPNRITAANLTIAQRTAAATAMGGAFTNTQRVAFLDAVGRHYEIVVPPPPDPADAQVVADAVRVELLNLFGPRIDIARPGLTNAEKLRAIRRVLEGAN